MIGVLQPGEARNATGARCSKEVGIAADRFCFSWLQKPGHLDAETEEDDSLGDVDDKHRDWTTARMTTTPSVMPHVRSGCSFQ